MNKKVESWGSMGFPEQTAAEKHSKLSHQYGYGVFEQKKYGWMAM